MLVALEVHYVEKNPEMFSSENVTSFPLKKKRHGIGVSQLSGIFNFEVN